MCIYYVTFGKLLQLGYVFMLLLGHTVQLFMSKFFFEKVYVNVFMCIVKGYKKFFWLPHRVHVMCVYEIVYNNRE